MFYFLFVNVEVIWFPHLAMQRLLCIVWMVGKKKIWNERKKFKFELKEK